MTDDITKNNGPSIPAGGANPDDGTKIYNGTPQPPIEPVEAPVTAGDEVNLQAPIGETPATGAQEADIYTRLSQAPSINNLFELVEQNGGIEGDDGQMISPDKFASDLTACISGIEEALRFIPDAHGLREKILELMPKKA